RLNRTVTSQFNLEIDWLLAAEGDRLPAKDHMIDIGLHHVDVVSRISVSAQIGPHSGDHRKVPEVGLGCDGEIKRPEIRVRVTRKVERAVGGNVHTGHQLPKEQKRKRKANALGSIIASWTNRCAAVQIS